VTNLQSLDLLQRDGFLVPAKLLKEILFITILLVIQQVHQPKELPHVVLHRSTCKNIGGTVADCAQLVVCAINVCASSSTWASCNQACSVKMPRWWTHTRDMLSNVPSTVLLCLCRWSVIMCRAVQQSRAQPLYACARIVAVSLGPHLSVCILY